MASKAMLDLVTPRPAAITAVAIEGPRTEAESDPARSFWAIAFEHDGHSDAGPPIASLLASELAPLGTLSTTVYPALARLFPDRDTALAEYHRLGLADAPPVRLGARRSGLASDRSTVPT